MQDDNSLSIAALIVDGEEQVFDVLGIIVKCQNKKR